MQNSGNTYRILQPVIRNFSIEMHQIIIIMMTRRRRRLTTVLAIEMQSVLYCTMLSKLNLMLPFLSDMSMNRQQSLFCSCTASMEQATDGVETAAIDGLVSSWSENISVSFCLRALGYGLTLWCALGAIQVPQLQLQFLISIASESVSTITFIYWLLAAGWTVKIKVGRGK